MHTRCHGHTPTPQPSPGKPRGRGPGGAQDACGGARRCSSESRGQGRAAVGDSAAPLSRGRSAEPPPGLAALAPALCYANYPSQLVPAACTMSAPGPRQPSPARELRGRDGAGRGMPDFCSRGPFPGPAWRGGEPPSKHHSLLLSSPLPSPMLAGPRPMRPAGHPLIHSSRPGCPPSRCQGLM